MPTSPNPSPTLACVVLSLGNEPTLTIAVRSLLDQAAEPIELVVINSGGGGADRTIARTGLAVPVVERADRLNAGAVRNLGVAATSAPFIAFLAADSIAAPGWVAGRLRRHREGAAAVACALLPTSTGNPFAWATHVMLYSRRMPGAPEAGRLLYGVSYARELFERFGTFPEELRAGEDSAFNQRLTGAAVPIEWAPEVCTYHRHPRTPAALLRDQFARGARAAKAWAILGQKRRRDVARDAFRRIPIGLRTAWNAAERDQRTGVAAAIPFLPLAATAYAAGALFGDRRSVAAPAKV